jgi:hypothetical protein
MRWRTVAYARDPLPRRADESVTSTTSGCVSTIQCRGAGRCRISRPFHLPGVASRLERVSLLQLYVWQALHEIKPGANFFIVLDTPNNFENSSKNCYHCQVIISWADLKGITVPNSSAERVALMQKLSENWSEPFRSLVHKLPEDVEVRSIRIEDWMFRLGRKHAHPRAVLVGDSAHTMTMCMLSFLILRLCDLGEACNANFKQFAEKAPTTQSSTCWIWLNMSICSRQGMFWSSTRFFHNITLIIVIKQVDLLNPTSCRPLSTHTRRTSSPEPSLAFSTRGRHVTMHMTFPRLMEARSLHHEI